MLDAGLASAISTAWELDVCATLDTWPTQRPTPSSSELAVALYRARARAERLRGLLAGVSPERTLTEELIAERRAEARAEADGG